MYLIDCVNAYMAAVQMGQKETDYQTAFALMKVKRQLQSSMDFLTEQEMKLAEKYAEKDEAGRIKWTKPGTFRFRDEEAAESYKKEREAICRTKVDETFDRQHAPAPEYITAAQLEALEPFISFGGEL